MKLREWLAQGGAQLCAGPHRERSRQDAETLLMHLIGKNKAWLMAHADDDFAGCTAIRYASLLERRVKGEPIQYIIGETEFYGMPFRVTPDVLIPRPETEHLVETISRLGVRFRKPRLVDVGTGSGAIAIAFAHDWPHAAVTAIDLSSSALEVARSNAENLGFADCIRFLQGDLLAPIASESFDLIVSNPPYVPCTDRDALSIEVRDHEPSLALFAGDDGLNIYRRLIPQAFACLVPGGFIALEIGYGQQPAIHAFLANTGFINIEFTPDLQGIPRVAAARRP